MTRRNPQSSNRRGSICVFVLVVIVLMAGLLLARAKNTVSQHRQTRIDQMHLQTMQLAEAGIRIAVSAWQETPGAFDYEWELPAGGIHQTNSGRVSIVTAANGTCTVVAEYPTNHDFPFRVTRTQGFSQ